MINYIIYRLTFPNGKVYIGQTKQKFKRRMSNYKNLNNSIGRFVKFAIKKYGWNNIKKEILFTTTKEYIDNAEEYFILKYNSNNKNFGYNLESGGSFGKDNRKGKHHTKKAKELISKNHINTSKENHPMWGKHHSNETKRKIGIANSKTPKNKKSISVYTKYGKYVKTFESIKQASEELNIHAGNICMNLKKYRNNKTAGGFIFKYNILEQ